MGYGNIWCCYTYVLFVYCRMHYAFSTIGVDKMKEENCPNCGVKIKYKLSGVGEVVTCTNCDLKGICVPCLENKDH